MTEQKPMEYFFFKDTVINGKFGSVFTEKQKSYFTPEDLQQAITVIQKSVHNDIVNSLQSQLTQANERIKELEDTISKFETLKLYTHKNDNRAIDVQAMVERIQFLEQNLIELQLKSFNCVAFMMSEPERSQFYKELREEMRKLMPHNQDFKIEVESSENAIGENNEHG